MRSSSEIITVSKRATKAAGYSWGVAEEVGKNIDVLELIGIAGIENLKSYLSDIKTKTPIGPNGIKSQNKINNESLCPILTGVSLIDDFKNIEILKEINFYNVNFPLLMIPFISRLSFLIGKRVSIEIDEYKFKFNLDKYMFSNSDINSLILENTKNVKIEVFENEDSFSQEVWDELYALSTDTFVEENEKLKSTAAGAGLEDND
ncbi:MAG: DUF3726 domain-containing protein [Candidatus Pelagibacterales bacterium]|jgi:hypothetical protein